MSNFHNIVKLWPNRHSVAWDTQATTSGYQKFVLETRICNHILENKTR